MDFDMKGVLAPSFPKHADISLSSLNLHVSKMSKGIKLQKAVLTNQIRYYECFIDCKNAIEYKVFQPICFLSPSYSYCFHILECV